MRNSCDYANLFQRLSALLIDGLVGLSVMIVAGLTLRVLKAAGIWAPFAVGAPPGADALAMWRSLTWSSKLPIVFAFLLMTGPLYFALCEASPWQATFGKRLMNIHVTDDTGARISATRSFGRWVAKGILNFYPLLIISAITILATKERRGLHDYASRTLVLKGKPASGGSLESWRLWVSLGVPYTWTVATFLFIL